MAFDWRVNEIGFVKEQLIDFWGIKFKRFFLDRVYQISMDVGPNNYLAL